MRLRLGIAAAAALLAAGCAPSPSDTPRIEGPPVAPASPGEVVGADALVHMQALQGIADANGGNRASPGPGYEASVDYVAGVLRNAGWAVSTPTYQAGDGASARQVVAQTTSGSSGSVVMAGAHLDSVRRGPGITDDGSGVAALLAIAEHLGPNPAVPHTVRFAFFGSEEDDLQGSRSYVESLARPDRAAILVYLNLDMISSSNAGYFVQGGADGDTEESGPRGSATVGRILVDQLARTGVVAELIPFTGDDDGAFVEAGIPTGGLLNGNEDEKTPEQAMAWGGQAGEPFAPCYHAACDRLDQVNEVALDRFTRATAGAVAQFAVLDGRPPE
jgi:aminopeptidase S